MPERPVEAVLREHVDALTATPGVTGAAVGERADRPCIRVFTSGAPGRPLPRELDGYPVVVEEVGELRAVRRRRADWRRRP